MTFDYDHIKRLFDAEHQPLLAKHCHKVHLKKGEHAVVQGQQSPGLWHLEQGSCEVSVQSPGETGTQTLATLEKGSVFGEISFIDGSQCTASITAIKDTVCQVLPRQTLPALEVLEPEVAMACIAAIAKLSAQRVRHVVEALKKENHAFVVTLKQKFNNEEPTPIDDIRQLINDACFHMMPEFKAYHNDELHTLCQTIPCYQHSKGSPLFAAQEQSYHPYLVLRGAIQSYFCHENQCHKLSVTGPGRFTGLSSFIDHLPRPSDAFARKPSMIMAFTEDSMALLKQQHSALFHKITIDMQKAITRNFRPFLMHLLQAQSMQLLA